MCNDKVNERTKIVGNRIIAIKYNQIVNIFNGTIPEHIKNNIMKYTRMDDEYLENAKKAREDDMRVLKLDNIKNTSWHGYWNKATGNDKLLYMCYIITSMSDINKDNKKEILDEYIKYHPKEKHIPQSILDALDDCNIAKMNILSH